MGRIPENVSGRHSEQRMRQVVRTLLMAEIISSRHFGITASDLRSEMQESGDPVCMRTVFRYVDLLVALGYVMREEIYLAGKRTIRYRRAKTLPRTLAGA